MELSVYDLICSRRSIRQFKPDPISLEALQKIVNAGRLAPSAANLQPLEFLVINKGEIMKEIFSCLKWAAYITPEGNPLPGQEPSAYIVILVNLKIREKDYEYDVGASIENMILAGFEEGVGSCWLISVDRAKVMGILGVPEWIRIDSVLALGYPAEKPIIEELKDSPRYWKDNRGQLHVPKRKLESIIHFNKY
jgi:nitroreductase